MGGVSWLAGLVCWVYVGVGWRLLDRRRVLTAPPPQKNTQTTAFSEIWLGEEKAATVEYWKGDIGKWDIEQLRMNDNGHGIVLKNKVSCLYSWLVRGCVDGCIYVSIMCMWHVGRISRIPLLPPLTPQPMNKNNHALTHRWSPSTGTGTSPASSRWGSQGIWILFLFKKNVCCCYHTGPSSAMAMCDLFKNHIIRHPCHLYLSTKEGGPDSI